MLSNREILGKFKEIFDQILPTSGATLKGRRELAVLSNVLTFSMVKLAKPDADGFANDNAPSKQKASHCPKLGSSWRIKKGSGMSCLWPRFRTQSDPRQPLQEAP